MLERIKTLRQREDVVEGGPTLWGERHLVHTDGSKVDFSHHPPGTIFWTATSLPKTSGIMQQFSKRGWPVTVYDYPLRKDLPKWLDVQLSKRGLDTKLAPMLIQATESDYGRLHLELDRLALSPGEAWQLVPAGHQGQVMLEAWAQGDCGKMLGALAQIKEQDLYSAIQRLVGHAHDIYALQNGQRLASRWHEMQVKDASRKVPSGWVTATLRLFTQETAPTALGAAAAVCKLDLEKRRAQRKVGT